MALTVLITGGTGFIGSNLAKSYLKQDAEVHLIIRRESDLTQIDDIQENIYIHIYDGEFHSLDMVIKKVRPDIVFHLASLIIIEHQSAEIHDLIQSNITFGTHLVEAMTKNGVKNFINTGTFWQHYNNDPYNPVNLYAATKEAFEKILSYYAEVHGLRYTTLKLFDTYGPNDSRKKLFHLLKNLSNTCERLNMSPGEQLIDLVYIDDVINAFMLAQKALEEDLLKKTSYAISSGNPIQLKKLVKIYMETLNIDKERLINWGGRPYRGREVMYSWNQGERLPGWEPKVLLKDGIIALNNN